MLKLGDLVIDPKGSLGSKYWLTEVAPIYQYSDNKRTDTIVGHRYTICLPERALEKINVKIDGRQLVEKPETYSEVIFENLGLFIYYLNKEPQIAARATGISLVNHKG